MNVTKKPGENSGDKGGIFEEKGPRGGDKDRAVKVPKNTTLPPTTKPGNVWEPVTKRRS